MDNTPELQTAVLSATTSSTKEKWLNILMGVGLLLGGLANLPVDSKSLPILAQFPEWRPWLTSAALFCGTGKMWIKVIMDLYDDGKLNNSIDFTKMAVWLMCIVSFACGLLSCSFIPPVPLKIVTPWVTGSKDALGNVTIEPPPHSQYGLGHGSYLQVGDDKEVTPAK